MPCIVEAPEELEDSCKAPRETTEGSDPPEANTETRQLDVPGTGGGGAPAVC